MRMVKIVGVNLSAEGKREEAFIKRYARSRRQAVSRTPPRLFANRLRELRGARRGFEIWKFIRRREAIIEDTGVRLELRKDPIE